ncbi:MAG: prepilin-type N-terminal cleavage/methylation domain-containing protein [Opitutales bacterium]|nr:prepilin-type N-terminal cleavage/methylation domain-containing protein [Opitutales bacterium]
MKNRNAFTLIELLVVIAIIAAMAVGFSKIKMGGSTQLAQSAQQILMSTFYEAKSAAQAKQARVRVLIFKGRDYERMLRHIGVVYEDMDENGESKGWIAISESMLPKGVFFVPPESDFQSFCTVNQNYQVGDVIKSTFNSGASGAPTIVGISELSKRAQSMSEGNGDWYCYEFAPEGFSENPSALVAVAMGELGPKNLLIVENPNEQLGFVIRRFGNCVGFSDYLEMETATVKK